MKFLCELPSIPTYRPHFFTLNPPSENPVWPMHGYKHHHLTVTMAIRSLKLLGGGQSEVEKGTLLMMIGIRKRALFSTITGGAAAETKRQLQRHSGGAPVVPLFL